MTRTVDEVDADLQTTKSQVPTLEGIPVTATFQTWTVSSTVVRYMSTDFRQMLFIAPDKPFRVLGACVAWEYQNLTASDTDYWQADLQIGSGATWTTVTTKSTRNIAADANGGIVKRTTWSFKSANWLGSDLDAGDIFACNWDAVGSPPALGFPMIWTLRVHEL